MTAQTSPKRAPEPPTFVERLRAAPVTVALTAANVIVFLVAEGHGKTTQTETLIRFGATEATIVWMGDWWRLGTAMFLHIGWVHLLWNTYASWGWCSIVERALGGRRFLATYLIAGVGGSCASVLCHDVVSAGASGAVFGIIGARLVLERRTTPDWRAFFASRATRGILWGVALWLVLGSTAVAMDNYAHAGGLLTGVAVTALLTTRVRVPAAAASLGFVVLAFFVLGSRPWHRHPTARENHFLTWYGAMFEAGEGAPRDAARAERFLRLACDAGHGPACQLLGNPGEAPPAHRKDTAE